MSRQLFFSTLLAALLDVGIIILSHCVLNYVSGFGFTFEAHAVLLSAVLFGIYITVRHSR